MGSIDTSINLDNVQGDILLSGLPKNNESFLFFRIQDAKQFCQALKKLANNEITHLSQATSDRDAIRNSGEGEHVNTVGVNIAFSFTGLQKLSSVLKSTSFATDINNMQDPEFTNGMLKDNLQDPLKNGQPDYLPAFQNPEDLHGVILVAGSDAKIVSDKLSCIKKDILCSSIKELTTISGNVRPGKALRGKEHFGYKDGISQPAITGIDTNIPPGQDSVPPGTILCNRPGDPNATSRPPWMTDGSFLCFRKLEQKVKEWDAFVVASAQSLNIDPNLLGARLIGRWKSGCPVTASPKFDTPAIGSDATRNNVVEFAPVGDGGTQVTCPLGAHIRKLNPRSDIGREVVGQFRVVRRGIPYGVERGVDEGAERGLLFVCYQSTLAKGFSFLQKQWANNEGFVRPGAGLDATVGQTNKGGEVAMLGLKPDSAETPLLVSGINRFVIPKGGEYFFSPSMSALKGILVETK